MFAVSAERMTWSKNLVEHAYLLQRDTGSGSQSDTGRWYLVQLLPSISQQAQLFSLILVCDMYWSEYHAPNDARKVLSNQNGEKGLLL